MNKIKQIVKSKFRTGLKTIPYIAIALLVGVTAVYAGASINKLIPSGNGVTDQMYSLQDIWNLADGTPFDGEKSGDIASTPDIVGNTGVTLSQVYNKVSDALASAGTPAPTFASADQTTYSCEALTTDPTQPAITLETICGYNAGCSWVSNACTGGTKTPSGGLMTWHAATASCAEKSDEGSSSWRLPTIVELLTHYMDNNNAGNPPTGFVGDGYWSGTTYQYSGYEGLVNGINMYNGSTGGSDKSVPYTRVRCVR